MAFWELSCRFPNLATQCSDTAIVCSVWYTDTLLWTFLACGAIWWAWWPSGGHLMNLEATAMLDLNSSLGPDRRLKKCKYFGPGNLSLFDNFDSLWYATCYLLKNWTGIVVIVRGFVNFVSLWVRTVCILCGLPHVLASTVALVGRPLAGTSQIWQMVEMHEIGFFLVVVSDSLGQCHSLPALWSAHFLCGFSPCSHHSWSRDTTSTNEMIQNSLHFVWLPCGFNSQNYYQTVLKGHSRFLDSN